MVKQRLEALRRFEAKQTEKRVLDYIIFILVRAILLVLGLIPHTIRVALCGAAFRMLFLIVPRLRSTALTNLAIAFPESSIEWRRMIIKKNCVEMGRLLADFVRLHRLSPEWIKEHVSCPLLGRYSEVLNGVLNGVSSGEGNRGVLIATGHLGSFELLGHAIGLLGYPLSAVARNFRSPVLDRWWTGLREARGNRIIGRKGAFKEMVNTLASGRSVAVLFDQNVTRNHAVFVDWFGKPAATTRSVALAAMRTEAPIFVASMRYCGADRYTIEAVECDCSDIYRDDSLASEKKIELITQRVSDRFCEMIRSFPEGWFWLHRRWKTRPEGEPERVYR